MSSRNTSAGASSGRRILANRRNALKSTGPRSAAGKRRVALNARRRGLCSEELEQQFRARGEDPREFRQMHCDLIAILHPKDGPAVEAVELMAHTWWEKARRIRNWVAAGQPPADDLDARLERLLVLFAHAEAGRHRWWAHRVAAVLGQPLGSPTDVRRKIEARLLLFGAKPGQRKYPPQTRCEVMPEDPLTTEAQRHRRSAGGQRAAKTNPTTRKQTQGAKTLVMKKMAGNGAEQTH